MRKPHHLWGLLKACLKYKSTRISGPYGPLKILAPAESLLALLSRLFVSLTYIFSSTSTLSEPPPSLTEIVCYPPSCKNVCPPNGVKMFLPPWCVKMSVPLPIVKKCLSPPSSRNVCPPNLKITSTVVGLDINMTLQPPPPPELYPGFIESTRQCKLRQSS